MFLCASAGERLLGVPGLSPLHAGACAKKKIKITMDERPELLFGSFPRWRAEWFQENSFKLECQHAVLTQVKSEKKRNMGKCPGQTLNQILNIPAPSARPSRPAITDEWSFLIWPGQCQRSGGVTSVPLSSIQGVKGGEGIATG